MLIKYSSLITVTQHYFLSLLSTHKTISSHIMYINISISTKYKISIDDDMSFPPILTLLFMFRKTSLQMTIKRLVYVDPIEAKILSFKKIITQKLCILHPKSNFLTKTTINNTTKASFKTFYAFRENSDKFLSSFRFLKFHFFNSF